MKKRYKLLKWYPSLPKEIKEGSVFELVLNYYCFGYGDSEKNLVRKEVENNPEFWEEVIENDYMILGFKTPNNLHLMVGKTNQGWYTGISEVGGNDFRNEKWLLKYNYKINSIKRLSDMEVFSVGDEAKTTTSKGHHKIKSFKVSQKITHKGTEGSWVKDGLDRIWVEWENNEGGNWLDKIEHYKPLFTTVDNVDIYKEDSFYVVINWKVRETEGGQFQNDKWKDLRFSTKEKAEEYIVNNKPCLSFKDVKELVKINLREKSDLIDFIIKTI